METIKGYTLTKEETEACLEMIQKMRAERERERVLALHRQQVEDLVTATIDAIGLDETKRIIRHISRDLRCAGGVSTD